MLAELALPTIVAEATRIQGEITFYSAAQLYGVVEGQIYQQSLEKLQVGKTGWISGTIQSQGPVVIEGRVEGNVISATKIELLSTATVQGTLSAPSVVIRPGAMLEGKIQMPGANFESAVPQAA